MINNIEKLVQCTKQVLQIVDALEQIFGEITINSGFRSPELNNISGGASGSAHLSGQAVDISVKNTSCIKVAAKALEKFGSELKGVGLDVFQNYVHLDFKDRGVKSITYWVYGRDGKPV